MVHHEIYGESATDPHANLWQPSPELGVAEPSPVTIYKAHKWYVCFIFYAVRVIFIRKMHRIKSTNTLMGRNVNITREA